MMVRKGDLAKKMMEIVVWLLTVTGCVLCYTRSASYNRKVEEKYRQGCINWWWSALTALLLSATLLTIGENIFWLFLLLTFGSAGLSGWICCRKMRSWGASTKEVGWGSAAQVASAVGLAAAFLVILCLLCDVSGRKKKRR